MATTIATTLGQAKIAEQQAEQTKTNPLANIWLGVLAVCLGGTLLCTAVLVAWPIIAKITAG